MSLLGCVAALAHTEGRSDGARALAHDLGAEEVVLLVWDPVLPKVLLPAPGMPQTLRGGARWRAFLTQCEMDGWHKADVDLPLERHRSALALAGSGMVLVLLESAPVSRPNRLALETLLPLLGAVLSAEQEAVVARSEAAQSREAALRAHALTRALDEARSESARLNAQLREEHVRKDEFLAMLAHELRNPLSPIVTSAQVLRHASLGEAQRQRQLEVIERQAGQLSRLVEDLLDVSRVSRGRIELKRTRIDLRDVLRGAVEASGPAMQARQHDLSVQLSAEPLMLEADEVRLTQVFANLLHNAAKYTDPGGHVRLFARQEQGWAVIGVEDDGIGIPPPLLSRIFDLFMQAPVALDRSQGGLGIGLTLVRLLVQLHGGNVSAESAGPRTGTRFTVRLPLAMKESLPMGQRTAPRPRLERAPGRHLRVLLVDDNHDAADSLADVLRLRGHHVDIAYNGAAALRGAEDMDVDLVLLDLGLPTMDGFEVAQRLRRREGRQPYIVALTGYGSLRDRQRTREAGFDAHKVKPLGETDLDELLHAAAERGLEARMR